MHTKGSRFDAYVGKLKALKKAETMMVLAHEMATRTPTLEMVMMQRLLEDRFHLKMHYEQRLDVRVRDDRGERWGTDEGCTSGRP